MDISGNFYELKEEFVRLGFTDTGLIDQLRNAVYGGRELYDLRAETISVGDAEANFSIGLQKEVNGRLSTYVYEGTISVPNDQHARYRLQNFQPDVPLEKALELLKIRSTFDELDEVACYTPLNLKEVNERLAIYALPVDADEKLKPLQEALIRAGFNDPDLLDSLHEKIQKRNEIFYLRTVVHGSQADYIYTLHFSGRFGMPLNFNDYSGYIRPVDPVLENEIINDPDRFEWANDFCADVHVADATLCLEKLLPLKVAEQHLPSKPMTREMAMASLTNHSNKMKTQIVEQMEKTLKNLGFGEKMNEQLEMNIKNELPEFTLSAQHEFNQKKVDYTLHFRAGEERYFFNKFEATILNADPAKEIKQTFKINKGNGFTAKEAFNLMEGRAVEKLVFKDDERYHAWYQLDSSKVKENGDKELKQFHENYGYDVEKVLQGHGIKELTDAKSTDELLYSLKKGNVQQIHVSQNGEDKKYFVSANPQFKTVNLFDHQMKKIHREELIGPQQKEEKSVKQGTRQKEDQTEKKPRKQTAKQRI